MVVADLQRMFEYINPPRDIVPVTPDDDDDLLIYGRGIIVEGTGTVKVTTLAGEDRSIPSVFVPVGILFAIGVKRVWSTGTTATGIWIVT